MKNTRQNSILQVISSQDIETQQQLIDALGNIGIASTQATLSRDIKELHLVKELTPQGKYRYAAAYKTVVQNNADRLKAIFRESVISFARAQNIVVIKTLPGLAPAACSAIDGMDIRNLIGSIAGDDTAFLAMNDNESAERFFKEIENMLR